MNAVIAPLSREEATALVRPLASSHYAVDYPWSSLRQALASYQRDYGLNLHPDFQRGHVWTPQQQAHYIENVFRGVVPPETMIIQFNAPHWDDHTYAGELPREMQVIDGLQRLTAALDYLDGKVTPFGRSVEAFMGTQFDVTRLSFYRFRFAVHAFQTRSSLLQHYIDINAGGTPHSEAEIARVRGLLEGACD